MFSVVVAMGVAAVVMLASCQEAARASEEVNVADGSPGVIVTGRVVPGIECPAILTDDGRQIALSHLPASFKLGDRVTVRGARYAGSATCQQEVLVVEEVSRAEGE